MLAVPKLGTRISIIKDRKSNNSLTCRHMSSRKVYDVQNTLFNYSDSGQGRLNRVEPEERLIISIMTCRSRDSSPRYYIRIKIKKKNEKKSLHFFSALTLFFLFLRVHTYDMLKRLKFNRLKEVSLGGLAQHCDNPSSTFLQISDSVPAPRVNVVGPTSEGVSASQNLSTISRHDERVNREDFLIAKSLTWKQASCFVVL